MAVLSLLQRHKNSNGRNFQQKISPFYQHYRGIKIRRTLDGKYFQLKQSHFVNTIEGLKFEREIFSGQNKPVLSLIQRYKNSFNFAPNRLKTRLFITTIEALKFDRETFPAKKQARFLTTIETLKFALF